MRRAALLCALGFVASTAAARGGARSERPVAQPPNDPYGNVIVVDRATGARVPGFPDFRDSLPVGGDGTGG